MTTLSLIKSQVMYLFKTNPKVHIDISNRSDRKHLTNVPAVINAVYPNIFTARLKEDGIERNYTFQYVDILTHTMEIKELNKLITSSLFNIPWICLYYFINEKFKEPGIEMVEKIEFTLYVTGEYNWEADAFADENFVFTIVQWCKLNNPAVLY